MVVLLDFEYKQLLVFNLKETLLVSLKFVGKHHNAVYLTSSYPILTYFEFGTILAIISYIFI